MISLIRTLKLILNLRYLWHRYRIIHLEQVRREAVVAGFYIQRRLSDLLRFIKDYYNRNEIIFWADPAAYH